MTSEIPFTAPPEVLNPPQSHCPDPPASPAKSVPDLSGWFHALEGARAPHAGASPVIPMGFGGPENVDDAAWLGDKYLGIAVAEVLVANGVRGRDDLTRRLSTLVSNANMARRIMEILPEHLTILLPSQTVCARQVHDCGTVVEACVHFVREAGHGAELTRLAEYLYSAGERDAVPRPADDAARTVREAPRQPESDPKGRVLQLDRHAHWTYDEVPVPEQNVPPIWSATLHTRGQQFTSTAVQKKAAAAAAAVLALAEAGITTRVEPTRALALEERHQVAQATTERLARTTSETGGNLLLSPVKFEARNLKPHLKDDETPLQWLMRKCEPHRLACVPVLFPHAVQAVHIWHAHVQEVGHIAVIIVVPVGEEEVCVYASPQPQKSKTKAQQTACKPARDYIADLIDMLPS